MLSTIFRYFFPRLKPQDKLPLLPRQYSSTHAPGGREVDAEELRYIKGKSAARTDADAQRLMNKHTNKSARHVARLTRRQRRRENRFSRAWRKFLELGK